MCSMCNLAIRIPQPARMVDADEVLAISIRTFANVRDAHVETECDRDPRKRGTRDVRCDVSSSLPRMIVSRRRWCF